MALACGEAKSLESPNSSIMTGRSATAASSQMKAALRCWRILSCSIRYTCGPTKSTSGPYSSEQNPESCPVVSTPHCPSPRLTGWVPPPALTALTMSSAQELMTRSSPSPP